MSGLDTSGIIKQPSQFDIAAYLNHEHNDVEALSPARFEDEVIELFYGGAEEGGALLPWGKTYDLIKFREHETTVWAGWNGHGKSQATTQVALDMAYANEIVVIGSFEMAPKMTLYRMIRQAFGVKQPRVDAIKEFLLWAEGKIYILNKRGSVDPEYVNAAARYCRDKYKATQFFCDNLAKVVKGEDDFNAQKDFVESITTTAIDTGMHFHLIHHLKKAEDETKMPGKMSVKGTGAITDLVDNVIVVWRNKKKELNGFERLPNPDVEREPDQVLNVVKQRNGSGWEGPIGLWYRHEALAWVEHTDAQLKFYRNIWPDLTGHI
jgi:twinkle protein